MTDILTNSASIPYGTWGGGRSLTQSKTISIPANNVPYTYSPLVSNIYISTDMTDVVPDTRPVITNMANYAEYNIPNYVGITEIPSGHLPIDINTSIAQNWSRAFNGCFDLTSLPDSFYDTSNATNMSEMFLYCYNLTTVPNFDTSNVTDMHSMFRYCNHLTTIPNFNTSKVTHMEDMFAICSNLTTVPNFDTSNVTSMAGMFAFCYNITIPNFDTSNVTNMFGMFRYSNISNIPSLDLSNVSDMANMFECYSGEYIPIININNASPNTYLMFYGCTNVRGNIYIESNNISDAYCFFNDRFTYSSNHLKYIYCHANSNTYKRLGSGEFCSTGNYYALTMEDNYAVIPINGNGIYRFPTNKIQISIYDSANINKSFFNSNIIEVSPYTDYELQFIDPTLPGEPTTGSIYVEHNGNSWGVFSAVVAGPGDGPQYGFRFFKDITNMTANVVDIL